MSTEGTLIQGKYRLERLIARGGMGTVWAARDEQLRRPVAVKLMTPELVGSPAARARFEREAVAAAQLQTPHVVQVFDHGVDGETPFIVMELLEGEDLSQRLKRVKRFTLPDAADLAVQIARALRKAHEAGIVHRDLKPPNVFLARSDDAEIAKILDFGVAKAHVEGVDGESTSTGMLMGSPHYMSPEQARGLRAVDHRSDLWSFGVILFKVLTGHAPFRGEATGDVIVRICADPLPRASTVVPELPAGIDAFFDKALCRDVEGRFQSAAEMASALVAIAGRGAGVTPGRAELGSITVLPPTPAPTPAPAPAPRAPVRPAPLPLPQPRSASPVSARVATVPRPVSVPSPTPAVGARVSSTPAPQSPAPQSPGPVTPSVEVEILSMADATLAPEITTVLEATPAPIEPSAPRGAPPAPLEVSAPAEPAPEPELPSSPSWATPGPTSMSQPAGPQAPVPQPAADAARVEPLEPEAARPSAAPFASPPSRRAPAIAVVAAAVVVAVLVLVATVGRRAPAASTVAVPAPVASSTSPLAAPARTDAAPPVAEPAPPPPLASVAPSASAPAPSASAARSPAAGSSSKPRAGAAAPAPAPSARGPKQPDWGY